jgi:hypothetical protein
VTSAGRFRCDDANSLHSRNSARRRTANTTIGRGVAVASRSAPKRAPMRVVAWSSFKPLLINAPLVRRGVRASVVAMGAYWLYSPVGAVYLSRIGYKPHRLDPRYPGPEVVTTPSLAPAVVVEWVRSRRADGPADA